MGSDSSKNSKKDAAPQTIGEQVCDRVIETPFKACETVIDNEFSVSIQDVATETAIDMSCEIVCEIGGSCVGAASGSPTLHTHEYLPLKQSHV